MEIKQPKSSGFAVHKQFMGRNIMEKPKMPIRTITAVFVIALVAIPAGVLVGIMYPLGTVEQEGKVTDVTKAPNIIEPDGPKEVLVPQPKEIPNRQDVAKPEPSKLEVPKEAIAGKKEVIQPPQEAKKEQQEAPNINVVVTQNITFVGASLGVRRAM